MDYKNKHMLIEICMWMMLVEFRRIYVGRQRKHIYLGKPTRNRIQFLPCTQKYNQVRVNVFHHFRLFERNKIKDFPNCLPGSCNISADQSLLYSVKEKLFTVTIFQILSKLKAKKKNPNIEYF